MIDYDFKEKYSCEDFIEIMKLLRSPGGCPWDIEQTHESIKKNLIEETYEVIEAINKKDVSLMREELGDLFMQVIFHTIMEEEKGNFNFDDVVDEVSKKLIIRHPHVFGDVNAETVDQVLTNWDAIKKNTKGQKTTTESMLSVPRELPALMRAAKVQKKAADVGFDWDNVSEAFVKINEETDELRAAIENNDTENIDEEFGDLLFAAVNVSRFLKIDAEESLTKATDKFLKRFSLVEEKCKERGIDMKSASLAVLDSIWDEIKHSENF
jgi:tetrapyrrole methylase family protein/MazG family protein